MTLSLGSMVTVEKPCFQAGDEHMRIQWSKVGTVAIVAVWITVLPRQAQGGAPVQLPAGPGQGIVQSKCTQCHALNLIVNSAGFTKEGWAALTATMLKLPSDQSAQISTYLATNFPEKPV